MCVNVRDYVRVFEGLYPAGYILTLGLPNTDVRFGIYGSVGYTDDQIIHSFIQNQNISKLINHPWVHSYAILSPFLLPPFR